MIFSIGNHVEQIKAGVKTQTRRSHRSVTEGRTYAIQPGRGRKGIPDGRIHIMDVRREYKSNCYHYPITSGEAKAEGGYTSDEYEDLYEKMYPDWKVRYAFHFYYVRSSSGKVRKE